MQVCTIDFETYYDPIYSLSKLTTEQYVRAPLFETIGFAAKFGSHNTDWVRGDKAAQALSKIDWSDKIVVAQNTAFDGAIMAWHYGIKPAAWVDIMGMSRALFPHEKSHSLAAQAERAGIGAKGDEVVKAIGKRLTDFTPEELHRYGQYCINDVELTYKLFNRYMDMGFPKKELRLIDLTLRMFIEPELVLDLPLLEQHYKEVVERKVATLETVRDKMLEGGEPEYVQAVFAEGLDGVRKLLMSGDKFAQALQMFGVEPPMKKSPTTGKPAYAFAKTDEAFKALEEHPDTAVQALVAARLSNKTTLEETRTSRFMGMASRGAFPIPLRYYGAHSGRWSGEQSVNLQNLPARGANANKLKKAIKAPPGYVVIDCDSAQIEARTLAWLAGQDDLVHAFRMKEDVYKLMASKIYGVKVADIDKTQRQVGKTVVLGAGYGVGHVKLQAFLKTQAGVEVSLDEAKRIIDTYRTSAYRIKDLWDMGNQGLRALLNGQSLTIDAVGLITAVPGKGLTLPNGLFIQYPELRTRTDPDSQKTELVYTSKGLPVRIYGGKCVAADTEVLTSRGWVPITQVGRGDHVWDGEEWVQHGGLTYQGYKPTIVLNGVRMTADHKVLTSEGWENASACQGLHGADFRMPDGDQIRGGETPFCLGVSVRVRQQGNEGSDRRGEVRPAGGQPVVRVPSWQTECHARDVSPSGVPGVAVYAGSLPTSYAPSVAQLRRTWHHGLRGVGSVLRGLLERHGADVRSGPDAGPQGQQPRVQPGKLSVGIYESAGGQPQAGTPGRSGRGASPDWGTTVDAGVSMETEPVYDLLNAGPRARFVVRGATGPFIVHNCVENFTQAVARCIVAEQMLRVSKYYKPVLTVHDAIAIIAPEREAKAAQECLEEAMSWNPKWAAGLPLACESGVGASYGDC